MSETVKISERDLMDVASDVGVDSIWLLEQAASDGIITSASGFNKRGCGPDSFHLVGERKHFEVYVQRLVVTSR